VNHFRLLSCVRGKPFCRARASVSVTPIRTAATSDHGCRTYRLFRRRAIRSEMEPVIRPASSVRVADYGLGPFFRSAVDLRLLQRGVFARRHVGQHALQAVEFYGPGEVVVER
jgi:hypothetical protein